VHHIISPYGKVFDNTENALTGLAVRDQDMGMDDLGQDVPVESPRPAGEASSNSVDAPARRAEVSGVQSVHRALQILDAIAFSGGEATLSDLAKRVQLKISTCHHLLSTLVEAGYAAKRRGSRSYVLGSRILALSTVCLREVNLPQRAQRVIEVLNAKTREAVQLAVLQGDDLVTVIRKEALHAVRVDAAGLGKSDAGHATASGKAILAWIPDAELVRIVEAKGLRAFTEHTITDFEKLREELRLVRRLGFAMDREEFQLGVLCIGAPIRTPSGTVIGSISVSCPLFRADEATIEEIRNLVVSAAQSLSSEAAGPATPIDADKTATTITDSARKTTHVRAS
jgi:IclR family acetate operon transcriptional repressor